MDYLNSNINISVLSRKVPVRAAQTRNQHGLLIIIQFVFLQHMEHAGGAQIVASVCVYMCVGGAWKGRDVEHISQVCSSSHSLGEK